MPIKLVFLFFILTIYSCKEDEPTEVSTDELLFAFLAHTRMEKTGEVNPLLETRNWNDYHYILLGGDLDENFSSKAALDMYVDVFNLRSDSTLLALGNHDYSDIDLYMNYIMKASYYGWQENGLCVYVADTQIDGGNISGSQLDAFEQFVADSNGCENFVFLSHKLLWMRGGPSELEDQVDDIANGRAGGCFYCTPENNFYDVVYPVLSSLQEDGIQVICLAGDVGHLVPYFEYTTEEGITFLANGWDLDDPDNTFLEFYRTEENLLNWEQIKI